MSQPWDFLDDYRGKEFDGQWPTVPQMFTITAKRNPLRKCFTNFGTNAQTWNYSQAFGAVQTLAGCLKEQGVKAGDRVAITGKNSPQWGFAFLASLYAGAVVVPLDHQLSVEDAIGLLKHSDSKILFTDEEKYDEIKKTKGLKLKKIFSLVPKTENYCLDVKAKALSAPVKRSQQDLAAILYTSGTTGMAKGVMLSHENLVSDCYLAQANLKIYSTDIFYALLPLHHSYSMQAVFIEALSVGAELVFGKKLAVSSILNDLSKGKITMFLGVPALYNKLILGILKKIRSKGIVVYGLIRLLMSISFIIKFRTGKPVGKRWFKGILKKASLDNIRICISGGGPLPKSTWHDYQALGIDFVEGYGLTETSPIITLNPKEAYRIGSVGKVLPQCDMIILDPDEEGRGEIAVRGPMVMQGYYKNEEITQEAFDKNGYFKTGDIGYLNKEKYLFLTGRAKSLIVTDGGKNVFPEEIENKFQLFDEIEQILVRGYQKDVKMKTEGVEAVFYPAESYRNLNKTPKETQDHFQEIVDKVNRELLPYQRISKIRILDKPMETTSKRTIKRHKIQF